MSNSTREKVLVRANRYTLQVPKVVKIIEPIISSCTTLVDCYIYLNVLNCLDSY